MDVRKALVKAGAVLEGKHFFALKKKPGVSTKYINMDPIYTDPALVSKLGALLIAPYVDYVDTIIAPAVGAIPLLYAAAAACKREVSVAWADKQADGTFAFERMGFAGQLPGQRVVVLEDVVSTGSSAEAVCHLVRKGSGFLLGISFIWNRGSVDAMSMRVPRLDALINESVPAWSAGEHKMWGKWPLVEDIGHPKYYPDYPGPRIKLLG